MYFEYLGMAGLGQVISATMTMFVGPFSSKEEREKFLEECHKTVSEGKTNPHCIKFILCDQLPVQVPDENEFEVTNKGDIMPATVHQWGATSPEEFLKSLKRMTEEAKYLIDVADAVTTCPHCHKVLAEGYCIRIAVKDNDSYRRYIVAADLPLVCCEDEMDTAQVFELIEEAVKKYREVRAYIGKHQSIDDLPLIEEE